MLHNNQYKYTNKRMYANGCLCERNETKRIETSLYSVFHEHLTYNIYIWL